MHQGKNANIVLSGTMLTESILIYFGSSSSLCYMGGVVKLADSCRILVKSTKLKIYLITSEKII